MKNDTVAIKRILVGNLKKYRAKEKLTQDQAAEKAEITTKYWQRLEMESQPDLPSLSILFRIAKVLGITASQLLKK